MVVFYRGPDPRSPAVIVTADRIEVRSGWSWQVWAIAELSDIGVVHGRPGPERVMLALGTSVLLTALVAWPLDGGGRALALLVLLAGMAMAAAEHRLRLSRAPSQLRARYRGADVLLVELPRPDLVALCRGLVRALDRHDDTR